MSHSMSHIRTIGALLTVTALASTQLHAQRDSSTRIDPRWQAYLGCWSTTSAGMPGPDVCLLPTRDPNTVEMVTVIGDSIGTPVPITATGDRLSRKKDGCTGWDLARWSSDDRRLYTESEYTCDGGAPQRTSALFAHQGDSFSQIEGIKTRSTTAVRALRFRAISDSTGMPEAIWRRLPSRNSGARWAARVEAGAEVTAADVVESSKEVGAPVTEAWIAERGQTFALNATSLRALRDAGVATTVIDMMVAVSNPELFQVASGGEPGARQANSQRRGQNGYGAFGRGGYVPSTTWYEGMYFPYFGYGYGYGYDGYGYGARGGFYGNGLFNSYGSCWSAWNCGGFGWQGGGTYVIVPQPALPAREPGRAVNGRGYSQGGSSGGGRTAQPSPSVQSGGGGGGGSGSSGGGNAGSGGGSTGGSTSSGTSTGGGEQRTAKPRP